MDKWMNGQMDRWTDGWIDNRYTIQTGRHR